MTINQLMESILGKTCSIQGTFGDSTPFGKSSVNVAQKLCEDLGMTGENKYGLEMMYCGFTGMPMGEVFIGPVYYQRLKHLVSDKMHARNSGDKSTHTRQPLEGRAREGGSYIVWPQCYLIVVLVGTTVGDIIKFRETLGDGGFRYWLEE